MMHYKSHRGRWMDNPLSWLPRPTWRQRLIGWLVELFEPMPQLQARRRIDPMEPYGAWANGWISEALPKEKTR